LKYKLKEQEEIEAILFTGQNKRDIGEWMFSLGDKRFYIDRQGKMVITTFTGPIFIEPNDYIIYDKQDGDYWKMNSKGFENIYEPV